VGTTAGVGILDDMNLLLPPENSRPSSPQHSHYNDDIKAALKMMATQEDSYLRATLLYYAKGMFVTLKTGIQCSISIKRHSNTTFQLACFSWLQHFTIHHFLQTAGTATCRLACFLLL